MLLGDMFFPPAFDDELLLAVDDPQEAVVIEGADIATVHPAVGHVVS
ncbi:hypothetical protein ACIA8C_35340 [Nocardia sp. NPDC051321]